VPVPFTVDMSTKALKKPDGSMTMQTEVDDLDKKIDEYHQKSLVKQQIFSMITD
jgi:hypothetical protein